MMACACESNKDIYLPEPAELPAGEGQEAQNE